MNVAIVTNFHLESLNSHFESLSAIFHNCFLDLVRKAEPVFAVRFHTCSLMTLSEQISTELWEGDGKIQQRHGEIYVSSNLPHKVKM